MGSEENLPGNFYEQQTKWLSYLTPLALLTLIKLGDFDLKQVSVLPKELTKGGFSDLGPYMYEDGAIYKGEWS